LIFGASARAAAFSALRCGLVPRCADYFADRDLALACHVDRIDPADKARQFTAISDSLAPSPWFYCGGLENHPELVDRISRTRRLWGVDSQSLRAVRDPAEVAKVFRAAGIPHPRVELDASSVPRDGSWLVKRAASGAGRGIKPFVGQGDYQWPAHYFQERLRGPSYSALFIGNGSHARTIGVTRQLIGVPGHPFGYRGSIGPCRIAAPLLARLQQLGDVLSTQFGLLGWFGVDFVLLGDVPWPVEINPRYTASVEVYELALRRPLLAEHRDACEKRTIGDGPIEQDIGPRRSVIGKLILYANERVVVREIAPGQNAAEDPFALRPTADIPEPGSCFDAGDPVMTLFARGATVSECRQRLIRLHRTWIKRLLADFSGQRAHDP
jgi:predicted ATP-grasp superfamily ATP-dependent carboligase